MKILSNAFYKIPARERRMTVATMFTLARILLTPIIVFLIIMQCWHSACLFFICAASTDLIDGLLARNFDQKTFLGACLDPVADKIFLFSVFCALFLVHSDVLYVPAWFIGVMLTKEILQIIGAIVLYSRRGWIAIEANALGKITTFVQIIFVIWLLCLGFLQKTPDIRLCSWFLLIMTVLMCISFTQYSCIWVDRLRKKEG